MLVYDILCAIFWSITYLMLICFSLKYKTRAIPLTAIFLNFAWETCAMIEFIENEYSPIGLTIYIIWFLLDLILVLLFMFHESNIKENVITKLKFVISYCMTILALTILFEDGHFMLSCFVIDLIMAVCFVYNVIFDKLIKNTLIVITGIFRLLGDLFAWLSYRHEACINEIGITVLVLNIMYVILLIYKKTEKSIFSDWIEKQSVE